jgi:hypothetical protein
MQVRVVINNRDRLSPLRKLLEWLWEAGQHEIIILDNASSYVPLLEYYRTIQRKGVRVINLRANLGPRSLWKQRDKSLLQAPFVLTDSDCVPAAECPLDLIDFLANVGKEFEGHYQSQWGHPAPLLKVGPAFKLSNIPDTYKLKPWVLKWERHLGCEGPGRETLNGVEIYDAAIDTAFALYLRGDSPGYEAIRVGWPFLLDHLDWHVDSANPSTEQQYYEQHAKKGGGFHNWGLKSCYSNAVNAYCKEN